MARRPRVIPIAYGDSVADRITEAAGWAGIDTFGGGYVELALELGVKPERTDTIIDFAAAAKYRVKIWSAGAPGARSCCAPSSRVPGPA